VISYHQVLGLSAGKEDASLTSGAEVPALRLPPLGLSLKFLRSDGEEEEEASDGLSGLSGIKFTSSWLLWWLNSQHCSYGNSLFLCFLFLLL